MSQTTPANPSVRHGGRHPVHVGHLVVGLVLLCSTAAWGLVQADVVTGTDIRWLLPIPWLVAGAGGLAAITVTSLRRDATPTEHAQHTTETHPTEEQS